MGTESYFASFFNLVMARLWPNGGIRAWNWQAIGVSSQAASANHGDCMAVEHDLVVN